MKSLPITTVTTIHSPPPDKTIVLTLYATSTTGTDSTTKNNLATAIKTAAGLSSTSYITVAADNTADRTRFVVDIDLPADLWPTVDSVKTVAQTLWNALNPNSYRDRWTNQIVHTVATASPVLGIDLLKAEVTGGAAYTISAIGFTAQSNGDPHLHLATGKRADFRGEDGKVYSALSAPNVSLALQTTKSEFKQNFGKQTVHGTHFTKAFLVLRSNTTGRLINVTLTADITPWFSPITYVVHKKGEKPLKVSATKTKTFATEGINITAVSGSRVVITCAGWEVDLTRRGLYKPQPESKTRHFLDVLMRPTTASALYAHGIIGQSFNGEARAAAKDGKLDDYSAAEVTTTAQAEGAIEGIYTDYALSAPFQTAFKYSRFDKVAPKITADFASLSAKSDDSMASAEVNGEVKA